MKQLFGIPYHIESIKDYDKKKIVDDIHHNYSIDKGRNKWDEFSNLHHANKDSFNKDFKEIDFKPLITLYKKSISNFLSTLKGCKNFYIRYFYVSLD